MKISSRWLRWSCSVGLLARWCPVAGSPDAGAEEADKAEYAVVGDQAGVTLDPPAGVVAEVREQELGRGEAAVRVRAREPDAVVAEADDVGAAVTRGVGHQARVALDA